MLRPPGTSHGGLAMVGAIATLKVRVGVVDPGLFISQCPSEAGRVCEGNHRVAVPSHAKISCLHLPLASLQCQQAGHSGMHDGSGYQWESSQ